MKQGIMFKSIGIGLFSTEKGYVVDVINQTCLCKGFYYGNKRDKKGNKTCKHLDFFKEWGYKCHNIKEN